MFYFKENTLQFIFTFNIHLINLIYYVGDTSIKIRSGQKISVVSKKQSIINLYLH